MNGFCRRPGKMHIQKMPGTPFWIVYVPTWMSADHPDVVESVKWMEAHRCTDDGGSRPELDEDAISRTVLERHRALTGRDFATGSPLRAPRSRP